MIDRCPDPSDTDQPARAAAGRVGLWRIGAGRAVLAVALVLGVAWWSFQSATDSAASSAVHTSTVPPVSVAPSAGCQAPAPVAAGQSQVAITAGGEAGIYFIQVPTTYRPSRPMPLVIDLHGYFETAQIQVNISDLGAYGQSHGFITVTPQVTEPVPYWLSIVGSRDLNFFAGVLTQVEDTACIDQNRVFVTGYSNGAFMTSAVACQFADRVAAVAPVAGIQDLPHCHPSRPVPVVSFHGTADPYVHFNGTPSKAAADLPSPTGDGKTMGEEAPILVKTNGMTIPQVTAAWAVRNHCARTPSTTKAASGVTLIRYRCPANAEVELYVVKGGGHAWPGSQGSKLIHKVVGFTTFAISADAIMWRFFEAHPLARAR